MTADTQALGQQILDLIGVPKDEWEIAAQLEVMGLRDAVARSSYGARDLFELARSIYAKFQDGGYRWTVEPVDDARQASRVVRFLKNYLAGLSFSLPMALQGVAMVLWGYGVWGAVDIDLRTGSAIALGFIASYVITGGFMQSIVRRGLFYVYQQEEWLARWAVLRSWILALRIVLGLLVPALAFNALFGVLPWPMVLIAAGYYAGLSILWLNWALIYMLRRTWLFLLTTAVALAAVIVSARVFHLGPVAANAVGLVIADVLSFTLALRRLNALANRSQKEEAVNPPRLTVLVYSTSRFFLYGLLYNTFLFADRIIAWTSSTGREDFPPYAFWMNVRYELGMDLALVVVMILSGVVEHAAQRFSEELVPREKAIKSIYSERFVDEALSAHAARGWRLGLAAILAAFVAVAVALTLRGIETLPIHASLVSATTARVFVVAVVAYVIFMFALQNVLMLLTLARVEIAVRAVAIALAADAAVGFVASRAWHYSGAVFGLLAGAVVLAAVTSVSMRRVLQRLDYHYYAAY